MKYIFILGGVISGLGKGITCGSIGAIIKELGYSVTIKKLDPYLNIDPGTMNPREHGEVYVTDDGAETDLDIGTYERFAEINASKNNSTSSGKLLYNLLQRERAGEFLGKTVQLLPHFTNTIQNFITTDSDKYDFIICEIGGSVGDYEAGPYQEAIRQLRNKLGKDNVLIAIVAYILYYKASNELKTKPAQNAVKQIMQYGIQPDLLFARTEYPINDAIKSKLSLYTNIPKSNIIQAISLPSIYQLPLEYYKEGLVECIKSHFGLDVLKDKEDKDKDKEQKQDKIKIKDSNFFNKWTSLNNTIQNLKKEIVVTIVGKYVELEDAYYSVIEALNHAGWRHNCKIKLQWYNARFMTDDIIDILHKTDAVIVPGGFGYSGMECMIQIIEYCREFKIPFLGICLGMQLAVIEFARNVLKISGATSTEFLGEDDNNDNNDNNGDKNIKDPVCIIDLMTKWIDEDGIQQIRVKDGDLGGTMRLGEYVAKIKEGSLAHKLYQKTEIKERHRHRYDVNINYREQFEKAGMIFSGISPNGRLPEIVELSLKEHPFFIGSQFHPEFKSSPFKPHPLFVGLVKSALNRQKS